MDDILQRLSQHTIDSASPTPLYYQLYTMLYDAITSGELPSGSKIPSEKSLAASFKVSRITARRALDELAVKNMVARHRGRGTFVDYQYQPDTIHAPLTSLMSSFGHMGRDTRVKVLSLRFEKPPGPVRETFGLEEDDDARLCHQVRVRSKNGKPFGYFVTWTRGFDKNLTRGMLEAKPRLVLFKEFGLHISRIEQTLGAEGATAEVARALNLNSGKPLLKLHQLSYDNQDLLLDQLTALFNPDRFRYRMEMQLDQA